MEVTPHADPRSLGLHRLLSHPGLIATNSIPSHSSGFTALRRSLIVPLNSTLYLKTQVREHLPL